MGFGNQRTEDLPAEMEAYPLMNEFWEEKIALRHVIDAYRGLQMGEPFFGSNNHFELLAGQGYVREMILDGADADSIAARWSADGDVLLNT